MRRSFLIVSLGLAFAGCGDDASSVESPTEDATSDSGNEETLIVDSGEGTDTAFDDTADVTPADTTTGDSNVDTSVTDTFAADTFAADTFAADTFVADTFVADTFVADTFVTDTFVADTFVADTFVADTFVADTFVADTAVTDTYVPDTADAGGGSCATPPPVGTLGYTVLSAANVYVSGAGPTLRSCWLEFTPAYELWSDGLAKRRWVFLPPGTTIATGPNAVGGAFPNMDEWEFPVGTRFLKEFARASDGKKLETRLWERTATGYRYGSFLWRADQTDAVYTESGGTAAFTLDDGVTPHQVPRRAECAKCHDGERGKGLGFSAVQLSKPTPVAGDVTLLSIIAKGWLSHPPSTMPAPSGSPVPGTATESAAIGGLHAMCGHCHNPNGNANAVDMNLRVSWGHSTVASTKVWTTAVGVPSKTWSKFGITLRIDPGTAATGDGLPSKSAVYYRASVRGTNDEMPPLGTALPDNDGLVKSLDAWIKGL